MGLGYDGPLSLRKVFAHEFWIPFARLSLGAFLYLPMIVCLTDVSSKTSRSYTSVSVILIFFSMVIMAYIAGLIQYLIIEKPILNTWDFLVDLSRAKMKSNK